MDEYIERGAALRDWPPCDEPADAYQYIRNYPAADVRPVVRCRDCKWFGLAGCAIQIVDDTDKPSEDDFCSFGERKGGDE